MTLEEYRKEKKLSYYNLGLELGIIGVQNPGTSVQRWCLTAKVKAFSRPRNGQEDFRSNKQSSNHRGFVQCVVSKSLNTNE